MTQLAILYVVAAIMFALMMLQSDGC